ncbi:MAG: response regulator [Bacteroidota bacterium]
MEPFLNSANPISVLLDINMPVLDGWGVLDHLEKLNLATIKNIQLYIVSSSMDKSDVLKANQYGLVKKFFHKPLKKEDILEILNGN